MSHEDEMRLRDLAVATLQETVRNYRRAQHQTSFPIKVPDSLIEQMAVAVVYALFPEPFNGVQ